MARPREYEEHTRVHMGTRFDRVIIKEFDRLCYEHRMSRTQALECLVSNAIQTRHIPPFAQAILSNKPASRPILKGPTENRKLQKTISSQGT